MAFLEHAINLDELPESSGYELLPAGWYNAKIVESELKNNKKGTGQLISVKYSITGPTHQGRTIYGNMNIRHQNTKAEEIGRQQLGELMRALNITNLTKTEQLLDCNVQIKITQSEEKIGDDGVKYDAKNEIRGFKASTNAIPAGLGKSSSMPNFAKPADTPKPAGSEPPWAKK